MNDDNEQHGWSAPPSVPPKKWIEYVEWIFGAWVVVLFVVGFFIGRSIQF